MYTGRSDADKHITFLQILTCDQILLIYNTYCKTCKIVLILRHQSRMLRCLTADQCCTGLLAPFSNTADDCGNLLRIVLAACNIIKEEKRFTAGTSHIIHTHSHCINTDRVMFVHKESQFHLCAAAICT